MNLFDFVKKILLKKNKTAEEKALKMMHYNALQYAFVEIYLNVMFLLPVGYYVYSIINGSNDIEIIVMIASMQPKVGELGRQYMALLMDIAKTKTEHDILSEHLGSVFESEKQEISNLHWKKIIFDNTKFEFVRDNIVCSHQIEH